LQSEENKDSKAQFGAQRLETDVVNEQESGKQETVLAGFYTQRPVNFPENVGKMVK
jgi:hypothetical protein